MLYLNNILEKGVYVDSSADNVMKALKKKGVKFVIEKASSGEYILVFDSKDRNEVDDVIKENDIDVLLSGGEDRLFGSVVDQMNVTRGCIEEAQLLAAVFNKK